MERLVAGEYTVAQAAECLGLSERQVKRLKKGMKNKGAAALAHGNRGRSPQHTIPKDIRDQIVSLAQGDYKDSNSTHMSELLIEHQQITVSAKSITRILRASGVISEVKKHRRRRKSRDRMPQEGMLVQSDASPHKWLEDRNRDMNLHGAIDDATSKVLGLWFREQEDLRGYLEVLYQVVMNHGVPRALYTDGHTIFFSPKKDKLTIEEELKGQQVALTQLGRALDELGIQQIQARSPQAKGRVERLWETLQSRLVVEMRIAGISTMDEANAFLPRFIEKFNKRFSVEAANSQPAYMPVPTQEILETILCVKTTRTISNGSTISYGRQTHRLVDKKGDIVSLHPKAKVEILIHRNGSVDCLYQGQRYHLEPFSVPKPTVPTVSEKVGSRSKPVGRKPSPDNPWTKFVIKRPQVDPVDEYFYRKQNAHLQFMAGDTN